MTQKKPKYSEECEVLIMNKKSILYILLDLIFLAVFNTVFFVLGGTEHSASVWISYGFIHFAYLMILATPFLVRKSSSASVFGFSLYSASTVYFFVEFAVGLIFIFIGSDSFKASLAIQVIIAGIYAILLVSNLIANEDTADNIERHEDEVAYIKNAASRVKLLVGKASEKSANKEIEKAYDLLHSSPTSSISTVKSLEEQINNKVAELENVVASNNTTAIITISGELIAMTEERNRKLGMEN